MVVRHDVSPTKAGTYPIPHPPMMRTPEQMMAHPCSGWPELLHGFTLQHVPTPPEVTEYRTPVGAAAIATKGKSKEDNFATGLIGSYLSVFVRISMTFASNFSRDWNPETQRYEGTYKTFLPGKPEWGAPGAMVVFSDGNWKAWPGWAKADFEPGGPAHTYYESKGWDNS